MQAGEEQRMVAILLLQRDIGGEFEEHLHRLIVAVQAGAVQRAKVVRASRPVDGSQVIRVSTLLEQDPHHVRVAVEGRVRQRLRRRVRFQNASVHQISRQLDSSVKS